MIRIGVAGWDYADWNGTVYPRRTGRGFDRLHWISGFVDVVEVNSTFYRPVAPTVSESWARRTAEREGFCFTAKSHRTWTHEPAPVDRAIVEATLDGLIPLRDAGRLGALLVQFPHSVRFTEAARERIERLTELAADWPLVLEVRHASWTAEEAADWLQRQAAGWCVVDQPMVGETTIEPVERVVGRTAYLRLHGRNASDWFRADAGRDARYDYLYSSDELEQLAGTARRLADRAEELFVVQNNHFRGQALVNALQWKKLLGGVRPAAPNELVETYPELEPWVAVRRTKLF